MGCHRVILACLIVSAAATFSIPFVLKMGQPVVTGVRLIQGLTFSPVFSFLGQNTAVWAALKEQLWFLCTCIAAIILTPAFSWHLSNQIFSNGGFDMLWFLCTCIAAIILTPAFSWHLSNQIFSNGGFDIVFFIHASISLFLALVWLIFYRDAPQKHRWVNGLELNKIVTGKAQKNRVMERNSYVLVFKSVSVIAIWIAAFGYFFAFAVFAIFLPIYSSKVLHLTVYSAGSFSVTPFILMAFVHWLGYLLNKIVNCCGLTVKVRIFNTISLGCCAAYFLGLAVAAAIHGNQDYSTFHTIVHYRALVPLGLAIIGFYQSSVVVGRFFSQFILSHVQLVFSLAFILVPAVVVFWTPLNILRYWRIVFVVTAAVLVLSTVVFAVFGSGQPAHWAENSWDPTATHRMLQPIRMSKNAECGIMEMRTVDDYLKSLNE
uniref:Uncharacterized protein n=2 Tax=Panagrolaimus sp. JU765 TaxID=591449 RepID=A0AC34QMN6_9BILA